MPRYRVLVARAYRLPFHYRLDCGLQSGGHNYYIVSVTRLNIESRCRKGGFLRRSVKSLRRSAQLPATQRGRIAALREICGCRNAPAQWSHCGANDLFAVAASQQQRPTVFPPGAAAQLIGGRTCLVVARLSSLIM